MQCLSWCQNCFDLWNSVRLIKSRPSPTSKDVATKPKQPERDIQPTSCGASPRSKDITSPLRPQSQLWHATRKRVIQNCSKMKNPVQIQSFWTKSCQNYSYCPNKKKTFKFHLVFLGGTIHFWKKPKFSKGTINGSQLGTRLLSSLKFPFTVVGCARHRFPVSFLNRWLLHSLVFPMRGDVVATCFWRHWISLTMRLQKWSFYRFHPHSPPLNPLKRLGIPGFLLQADFHDSRGGKNRRCSWASLAYSTFGSTSPSFENGARQWAHLLSNPSNPSSCDACGKETPTNVRYNKPTWYPTGESALKYLTESAWLSPTPVLQVEIEIRQSCGLQLAKITKLKFHLRLFSIFVRRHFALKKNPIRDIHG